MPNSEVKRRSADGSVGSPHVRVGNCQASNKTKGSVERLGLLFCLLFVGKRTPETARHQTDEETSCAGMGFFCCLRFRKSSGTPPGTGAARRDRLIRKKPASP
ncbi:hypothetical protein, partial [Raoultella sp. C349492]|uniref:hypothetical protein n=1 Tax=Raoultella sp. C349492 TaxID=2970253 RepID=UPI0035C66D8A